MPTHLPNKPRAKAIPANDSPREDTRSRAVREPDAIETIDWLALWTLSIAFSAIFIAGLGFFTANDPVGASMVLFGAAAVMAIALGVTRAPGDRRKT